MRRVWIVALVLSAALVTGTEGAWAEAFTDPVIEAPKPPAEAQPDPALAPQPDPPAEETKTQEPPGTERLGTALDEIAKQDPLLATVNGQEIRWADIVESARNLPERYRSQIEVIFPALLERLIDVRLIAWAAREAGLAEDEEVRGRVAAFEDRLISETFVQREVAEQITTEMLRERYDAYVAQLTANAEVRARHILLHSERDANEVIAILEQGADFAGLARTRSLGPTAKEGGDLDYFTRDNMTPEFADAAFGLEVGEFTRTPIKTAFGWHVIKVEDRRAEEPGSLYEMRDALREKTTRDLMESLLRDLRAQAQIVRYPHAERVR